MEVNDDLLDAIEQKNQQLIIALKWWEKKRIWFNLAVGVSGAVPIFFSPYGFYVIEFIGILIYALFFNLLYSIGYLLESYSLHYFSSNLFFKNTRWAFFLIGTLASAGFTFFVSYLIGNVMF